MATGEPADDAVVFDFLDEFLRDIERGTRRPLTHYLERYKGSEEAVAREFFAELERSGLAATAKAAAPGDGAGGAGDDPQRVGPYRLLRELGRGGQGAVWLAEDTRIARHVALKLLPAEFAALSEERRRRLQREAEVIARLDHPSLCAVLEARIDGDRPYIAMRYVEGGTVGEWIARAREARRLERETGVPQRRDGPLRAFPRNALEQANVLAFFERAARALHAAHEAGVVHRDVKPQNVMVTRTGDPVVLDFGQARDETSQSFELTRSGDVLGTPAYMSPEQVLGQRAAVDRRTDVWSLGASLYEALTLARPFEGENVMALLMAVRDAALPDPRSLNPAIGAELAVVVATALEKEPARRYATALDFAEDLRRVREYEPIRARPPSAWRVFRGWFQRHPALAYLTLGSIVALSIGLASSLYLLSEKNAALEHALGRHLGQRADALLDEDPAAALALGIEAVERAPTFQTRASLFRALQACHLRALIDGSPARLTIDCDIAPDSERVAVAFGDGSMRVFALETGLELARVAKDAREARGVRFSPDGARLAYVLADGTAGLADARTGAVQFESAGSVGSAGRAVEFLEGGARFLALTDAGLRCLSTEGGAPAWSWSSPQATATPGDARLAVEPSRGRALVWHAAQPGAATPSSRAWLFDTASGSAIRELEAPGSFACADFPSDGASFVTGSADGTLRVWRASDGELERAFDRLGAGKAARDVRCSADGTRCVAILEEPQADARAWIVYTATGAAMPIGTSGVRVLHAAFSPDGARLATVGSDMLVRLWAGSDFHPEDVFRGSFAPRKVLWSADGRRLVTPALGATVSVWYAGARPDVYSLRASGHPVARARFAPDGERIVVASEDGAARVFATPSAAGGPEPGALLFTLSHTAAVRDVAFAPDGASLATASLDGSARLWSAEDGRLLTVLLPGGEPLAGLAFSAGGEHVALRKESGAVVVCDPRGAAGPRELAADSAAVAVDWLPSPPRVVTGHEDGTLLIHDPATGALLSRRTCTPRDEVALSAVAARLGVTALAVRPDGREVALACTDGAARFFDPASDAEEQRLWLIRSQSIDYSRDGTRLLVVGRGGRGALRLHDLELRAPRRVSSEAPGSRSPTDAPGEIGQRVLHTGDVTGGAFSPDGRWVITTAKEGGAYVRSARDGMPFAHFTGPGRACFAGAISPGAGPARALVAFEDGSVWIWPLDPLPAARARAPRLPDELLELLIVREQQIALPLQYEPLRK